MDFDFMNAIYNCHNYLPTCATLAQPGKNEDRSLCAVSCSGYKPRYSVDTKTVLRESDGNYYMTAYCGGIPYATRNIMPAITDVHVYNDKEGSPRAVRMDFADNTSTCVSLQDGDTYNFDYALSICITKKLLDFIMNGHGHQLYNKLVRKAKKVYNENRSCERSEREQEEALERKRQKLEEKKRRRDERKENEEREYAINLMKEAITRALNERG